MSKGEKGNSGIFSEFSEAVKKAASEAEVRNVLTIRDASAKTWQAAAWWLERRYPEKWGKQPRIDDEPQEETQSWDATKTALLIVLENHPEARKEMESLLEVMSR